MSGPLQFTVPLLPPSVNHYKHAKRGGGWYRGVEAIGFVDALCICSRKAVAPGEFYTVEITFHLPPSKRQLHSNDLDNYLKVAVDALGRAGVISNDARILDLIVHKRFVSEERDARTDYAISEREALS